MMYYIMNLWIITMVTAIQPGVSAAQDVEMSSTLNEGVAYNNQEIFFTCLVRGSNVLEWNSAEYVGQGGFPLQLSLFNGTDTNVSSTTRPSTYAVRLGVTRENGRPVIVSDLRIIASTQYSVATVTCGAQSSKNITFQTLSSAPATQDVTFDVTTTVMTTVTTIPPTTGDFTKFDSTPENQRSCTGGIISLAISLLVNVVFVILFLTIIIIKVRGKGSRVREFEAAATNVISDSPSGTKNDSQASGISPVPKPEPSSTKHEEKQKRKFLDVLQSGRELLDCMNLSKEVPTKSEDLVPALKCLSDALSTGTPSAFKEAIKRLTDNLRVKKVSDEVLEKSLEKLRETNKSI